jgi:hypothetical protein
MTIQLYALCSKENFAKFCSMLLHLRSAPQISILSQSTTTLNMASHQKHVNFGRVEIFEFPITLGDHPCVSNGPPVALEYYATSNFVVLPLHVYEMYRPEPRSRQSLLLSGPVWARSLAKNGFSRKEIRLSALEQESRKTERRLSVCEMKLAQSNRTSTNLVPRPAHNRRSRSSQVLMV